MSQSAKAGAAEVSLHSTRLDPRGIHQFRLPLGAIAEIYRDGEEALIAGDNTWVVRFAGHDHERVAFALFLMGNTVGAKARLAMAPPSPRGHLLGALIDWVDGRGPEAARAILRTAPAFAGRARAEIDDFLGRDRLKVLFIGGVGDRIGEASRRFGGIESFIGRVDGTTGRLVVERGDGDPAPVPDDTFDVVFVDPSHVLPGDIARFSGLKIAYIGDLEWHIHHQPAQYRSFDLLLALGTQGHIEASRQFACPAGVGPISVHMGFLDIDPLMMGDDARLIWRSTPRFVDVASTGRQRHGAGFYYDKHVFNRMLLDVDPKWSISMVNRMLPADDYRAMMSTARFVATSHRYGLGQSWRVFEAIGVGAMVLVDAASGAACRFSRAYPVIHHVRASHLREDFEAHLAAYGDYAAAFEGDLADCMTELAALVPPVEHGVLRTMRLYGLAALLARHGFPDSALSRLQGAGGDRSGSRDEVPLAVQSIYSSDAVKDYIAANAVAPAGAPYAAAREAMTRLALSTAYGKVTAAEFLARASAFAADYPDRSLPALLHAFALRAANKLPDADAAFAAWLGRDDLIFDVDDARPEWSFGTFPIGLVVDAAMRDRQSLLEGEGKELARLLKTAALSMRADIALRRSDFQAARDHSAAALTIYDWDGPALGIHLQALRRLIGGDPSTRRAFLSAYDDLTSRHQEMFHLFGWTAVHAAIGVEDDAAVVSRAAAYALSWTRNGRPPGAGMIPPWAIEDARSAMRHSGVAAVMDKAGIALP